LVIFVGNANLADSKFRCQRQHHSEARSKSSNRSTASLG
jgi:hypothetical protein